MNREVKNLTTIAFNTVIKIVLEAWKRQISFIVQRVQKLFILVSCLIIDSLNHLGGFCFSSVRGLSLL